MTMPSVETAFLGDVEVQYLLTQGSLAAIAGYHLPGVNTGRGEE